MEKAVTRFAPSPTGSLHIGGIRTALYAYALARKTQGEFILRIEDTDQSRLVEGSEQEIKDMLQLYGLEYDSLFRQSERLEIYKEHAEKLISMGKAFYCFATKEELHSARELAERNKQIFRFRSPYRDLALAEAKSRIEKGDEYVIRLKAPVDGKVEFQDALQGRIEFDAEEVDDTVLIKSDGFPTYHMAVVVDDHLMNITHVFRGVEWIPSAPKHVLLYEAFDWPLPVFVHLPLILDPEGGKLSKRKGSVAAKEFISEGYLPEAILNFLMLLGWSAPIDRGHGEKEREVFSLSDFIEMFDLHDLNKSSPVFNREKLLWFNQKYIQSFSEDSFSNAFLGWLKQYGNHDELNQEIIRRGPEYLQKCLKLIQERVKLLSEITDMISFFYFEPKERIELSTVKQTKKIDQAQQHELARKLAQLVESHRDNFTDWTHEQWEIELRAIAGEMDLNAGAVFMSLRLMLTGSAATPPLYEVMQVLSFEQIMTRIGNYQ